MSRRQGALSAYRKLRGTRLVTCPETEKPAAVEVDALHAAASVLFGEADLRLKECSRWPERAGCGQECLSQVESRPEACLVRTIVRRWYEGKSCALCNRPIVEIGWPKHRPALVSPENVTVQWHEVMAEKLPEVLATHRPVCWDCHVVATAEREHPGLYFVRPPRPPTLRK